MPSPICGSPGCDNPSGGGFICGSCVETLRRDLSGVPPVLADLEVTVSRQDRIADPERRAGNERPLPLRLGPMEARRDLLQTLGTWSAHMAQRVGIPAPIADCAGFLTSFLPSIQSDPLAGQLADECGYAILVAQRAVDKPLQLIFVGPCDLCTSDLYSHPRSLTVACRQVGCDAEYNVADRRDWLLEQAKDQLLSAAEISRALPGLLPRQQKLTDAMIRGWAFHGRITQKAPHPSEPRKPRYRLGDVLVIMDEIFAKELLPKKAKRVKKMVR